MKLLVFGQTGQVATELRHAMPDDIEAVFLGRSVADLQDPAQCAAKITERRPDVVINAAAYTAVDRAETEETLAATINGAAPAAMAVAAAGLDIPFLHLSTDYVFDGAGDTPRSVADATAPLGAYGRTKLAGEQGVTAAGGRHLTMRTSWVFSAHGGNFVKTMLRLGAERSTIDIVSDQVGGPTFAGDIAAALLQVARQMHDGSSASGTYHYAGAPDVSWADFARAIFTAASLPVTVNDIPSSQLQRPSPRPLNSRLDCQDLLRDFGIDRPQWLHALPIVLRELGAN